MKQRGKLALWLGITIFLSLAGCNDKSTTVEVNDNARPENRPPKIILWGPTYDSLEQFKGSLPQPWVIVGDSDGSGDIAGVVFRISKVKLVSLIVRPDDSTKDYSIPFYAPYDTINVMPYLKKQTFNVTDQILQRASDATYGAALYYETLTEGGIANDADVFGPFVKQTRSGYDYLYMTEHFGLYPPALPSPRDVYVTYAKLLISGMSITVYDQSGASATVSFPDFYAIFSNFTEDQTPP